MGYNLTIGKRILNSGYQDVYDDHIESGETKEQAKELAECWKYRAESEYHDDAPAFGEPTDGSNQRWPSYTSWRDFCDAAGITDYVYDDQKRSLRGGHPGYFIIDKQFKDRITACYKMFSIKYPEAEPTFDFHSNGDAMCDFSETPQNHTKARLVWLKYWVDHAFKEYGQEAIFFNS